VSPLQCRLCRPTFASPPSSAYISPTLDPRYTGKNGPPNTHSRQRDIWNLDRP
jgi:hypothetical protein